MIAAGRLSFAICQVQQPHLLQPLESGCQLWIKLFEDFLRSVDHLLHLGERLKRRPAQGIDSNVPWTQLRDSHVLPPLTLQFTNNGHDFGANGFMKPLAISRRIVKAPHLAEHVIPVVGKSGIICDLLTKLPQLIKDVLELFAFL
ncbi:hypothetical protein SDC9_181920 [bioreactor metagenome]|uniref:Uncharacterized protein n=1 Tax=bioreactor metagenome TaxID=1076179 RepID=A0A645H5Y2_9ZZZZ